MTVHTRRSVTIAAWLAAASWTVSACNDVTSPGGGGVYTDPRSCRSYWSSGWTNNNLQLNVNSPPCPFTVADGYTWVTFAAVITAPRDKIVFGPYGVDSYVGAWALNWYGPGQIGYAWPVYFQQDPGNQNMFRAQPQFSGTPGAQHLRNPANSAQIMDSLHVEAYTMNGGGNPHAWKILPGNVTNVVPNLLGPTSAVAGLSSSWRIQPHWDTTAYTYRWLLNGTEIANARGAVYTQAFSSAGTYNLSGVSIRSDNTADTVNRAVTVSLLVGVTGISTIKTAGNYSWSAGATGGNGSYTYTWEKRVDSGSYYWVGSGPSYAEYIDGSSGSTIDFRVTAASGGATGQAVKRVNLIFPQ